MIVLQTMDVEIVVSRVILGTTCFNYVKSYTWCVVLNGHNGEFCVYLNGEKNRSKNVQYFYVLQIIYI